MSLVVAIPLGVASAVVYGTSIVFQHREAHKYAESDAKGLIALLRNPRWLLAIGGDFVGFLLQIGALSTGPVVLIQPLVVLMLPVALAVSWLIGGPRPRPVDFLSSAGIIVGVGVFLALVGQPGETHVPMSRYIATTILIVLGTGMVACLLVRTRGRLLRGAVYGAAAGTYYGTLGVMVNAASHSAESGGVHGLFVSPRGLVPLIGVALLGVGGMIMTQVSFQVGALAATLPANLAADPFTGVVIGALLLDEHIPLDVGHVIGYALCLAAVLAGAIRLAEPATAPQPVSA
jgi:drug/metabolite transporter (DMT)-like permease